MATQTDAMSDDAQLMTATFEHVRNVLDTAEIGDEIVFNNVSGVVVDQHETETVNRTCLSALVQRQHDPGGDSQRYRIAATEPGRHADADVRFQHVIKHDDGRIDHTNLALNKIALGDEDAIEPPTSAEQAVTDGGTDDAGAGTDTVTDAMSDATPTTAANVGPTIDDTDDTDQLDDADIADDLGDTHWDVAEAISSADGGLTIRQLVEEYVDTKKPWTQRCARDLCDAGLVRRERDGRAYVYRMADATVES